LRGDTSPSRRSRGLARGRRYLSELVRIMLESRHVHEPAAVRPGMLTGEDSV
jgi:hypothetical protein